jgi:mono/diheme cytochrome c family protein
MGRLLFGILLGVALVPAAVFVWLYYGAVPVAVSDPPLPQERLLTHIPLDARIHRDMPQSAPFSPDEQTFIDGARIYREQCAACHGFHGKPSSFGAHMYPSAPALWEKHHNGQVVGVSDDPPGETHWKVANGIRLTGMPSYKDVLTDTQVWQVSLLLANADKPLPPAAVEILRGEPPAQPAAPAKK